eukprot:SAG25_NODE_1618_length_2662_cov_5.387437_1_plen_57_part_10
MAVGQSGGSLSSRCVEGMPLSMSPRGVEDMSLSMSPQTTQSTSSMFAMGVLLHSNGK